MGVQLWLLFRIDVVEYCFECGHFHLRHFNGSIRRIMMEHFLEHYRSGDQNTLMGCQGLQRDQCKDQCKNLDPDDIWKNLSENLAIKIFLLSI